MNDIIWGKKIPIDKKAYGHAAVQYGRGDNSRGYGMARVRTYVWCECSAICSGQGDNGGLRSYQRHLLRKKPEIEKAKRSEENIANIRKLMKERYPAMQRFYDKIVAES